MADFVTSTHRAKWIFTLQDLKEKYKAANQRAKQALEKYGSTKVEVNIDGSFCYAEHVNDAKDNAENLSRQKPLKVEEELVLRAFYEFKIQDVCDAFKFPRKIQATALIYFKRFYLQWSVMEHHPKHIMLTCIYAACKAEENHVSAEELGKGIEQDHQVILINEMLVLQSLGFDLIVYAPYRALAGFVNDVEVSFESAYEFLYFMGHPRCPLTSEASLLFLSLDVHVLTRFSNPQMVLQEFCGAMDQQLQMLETLHELAKAEVDKIMRTDAPLLFPPGQLALTALRRSNALHIVFDFESYLENILSRQNSTHSISNFIISLNAVDSMVSKLETPTLKDVKHIDRKLKSCLDPGLNDKSKKRKHRSKESSSDMLDMS